MLLLKLFGIVYYIGLVVSQRVPLCPDRNDLRPCTCDREGINCNWAIDGKEIQQALRSYVAKTQFSDFWMTETNVGNLVNGTFGKYQFQNLNIQYNKISVVEPNAFEGLEDFVRIINLGFNNLKVVPRYSIQGLTELTELLLNNNQIKTIPEKTFASLSSLTAINLAANQITTLGADAFNSPNLNMIDLNYNEVRILDDFVFQKDIDETYGWTLKMDENEIEVISDQAFRGISNIKAIFLRGNKLYSLKEIEIRRILDSMQDDGGFIHLDGNPVQCNANLTWLINLSNRSKMQISGVICNGKPVLDIEIDDLMEN